MEEPRIREALLYEKLEEGVRCDTCERHCKIGPGKSGFCSTRKNIDGKLYTLEYGDISSISANPIEKKPLFHFRPGSRALTVGTFSCNFTCPWCQNYRISKSSPLEERGEDISPEEFLKLMKRYNCQGTSMSFNEPTLLFEYSLEIFVLTRREGYYNTFVTNGYVTSEALGLLIDHGLDAMNVDIKGSAEVVKKYCDADVEMVWRNAREAKKRGVHIEITTLIIPGVNDDEVCLRGISSRIREDLGKSTPWHVTRYQPAYKFETELYVPPTDIKTLERAREIGQREGLKYIYLGNVPGHPYENTYCPKCGEELIRRYIFDIMKISLTQDKRCPKCGEEIPIIGEYHP
jgi:pyruvate formate lyase activating enzyme